MRRNKINIETTIMGDAIINNAEGNAKIYMYTEENKDTNIQNEVKSRTQEYADKWDMNMFLNDFKEWDENAGVNVKLSDVYLEEHLPHFIGKRNTDIAKKDNKPVKINSELTKYINVNKEKKMLLILGQPGIGKSTLITWITANFKDSKDNILVYQFAADLNDIDWSKTDKDGSLADDILKKLNLTYESLNDKTLIIDGFDEISVGSDRADILNKIYWQFKEKSLLKDFSLIITCREHYIENLQKLSCDYVTLQPWDEEQIRSFCKVYSNITGYKLSENNIMNILKNKEILGVPLILYMVLALNISIGEENSIVDVYDKIFALEGGIYDRCIDNENYAVPHRIGEIKKQIHQISREIAFWMFENNPDEASILKNNYQEICNMVIKENQYKKETAEQDFLLGNYFKKIRHCEGIETEEISFVHRTIYEYFVAEMIYNSIEEAMIELSDKSQIEFARNIAWFLKQGEVTHTIAEYLQHKIFKIHMNLNNEKKHKFYQWWENAVGNMMKDGMFHYIGKNVQDFSNVISNEIRCFLNLIVILCKIHNVSERQYIMSNIDRNLLQRYIRHSYVEYEYKFEVEKELFFEYIDFNNINLSRANLSFANLRGANLKGANLRGANLEKTDLSLANMKGVNLSLANIDGANLRGVHLEKADLSLANMRGVNLSITDLRECKLRKTDLKKSNLEGANLKEADLRQADLRLTNLSRTILKGTDIEASIWRKDDIQKVMPKLRETEFEHIIIEDENGQQQVSKNELFPDLQ